MGRIGLALSGGGFRATLYHLGVLRFLRDANLLHRVSHITSVSGGSIVAAHLVLNWQRYTGTEKDYNEASKELLDFIRMDVRNRVIRRFPLAAALNGLSWVLRRGWSRRLTRPGLLEAQYERFLYGQTCLYELPLSPQLHILATNVNEGAICSFTRSGIIVQKRLNGTETRFDLIPSAIATVPMAVTASSAFPGFFPPLQLDADDVGADESKFPPHLFTDGGVYDNLGVRMFRNIQESWLSHDVPLRADDFADLDSAASSLSAAASSGDESAMARLARLASQRTGTPDRGETSLSAGTLPMSLWNVIVHDQLYRDPSFCQLTLNDEQAADLLRLARRGRKLEPGEHLWLNRLLVDAAFRDDQKRDLFLSTDAAFKAVIVSDAGKQFAVSRRTRSGGLVGTAVRASDIVMNRVWELEKETFGSESDFVFAPISSTVHVAEDPTAPHPEIQHQVTSARTDLDRFSELEISGLVRHGYCVMRKIARSRPDVFGEDLPSGDPWDPTDVEQSLEAEGSGAVNPITVQARALQTSAHRRIFGSLFSFRDWPTYVFIPVLLLLLLGLPYLLYQRYETARRSEMIIDAIQFSNPDFQIVLDLARNDKLPGDWVSISVEEVPELPPREMTDVRLITDTRILDTRGWESELDPAENQMVIYRRMTVRKTAESNGESTNGVGVFHLQQFSPASAVAIWIRADQHGVEVKAAPHVLPDGTAGFLYDMAVDLSSVPFGRDYDISFGLTAPGIQGRDELRRELTFPIVGPTDVATMWVLLPESSPYGRFELIGTDPSRPGSAVLVEPTYRFEMEDGSVFGWMLVAPREDFTYNCRWSWRSEGGDGRVRGY